MYKKMAVLASLAAGAVGSAHALAHQVHGLGCGQLSVASVTVAESLAMTLCQPNARQLVHSDAGRPVTTPPSANAGVLDGSFVSYCVDLGQYLNINGIYNGDLSTRLTQCRRS